jgi:glycerophosphoryl diester phosphodiesterase
MKPIYCVIISVATLLVACVNHGQRLVSHYIEVETPEQLYDYFSPSSHRNIVISGHRGGMVAGYPENCIESFAKTLSFTESFFEIDPRLTKDSVIVLMHDATIDRTTTGKGRVSDYTLEELEQFNLVDREGNVTPYKIPTLKECIEWSRGKTILNFDIKDVPQEFLSDFIASLDPAPHNVMYTVHNPEQARLYLDRNPAAMFSCWCQTMAEFEAYEAAGIPWKQVMAYVGPAMLPQRADLYRALRSTGVMCMISVAPTHDRAPSDSEKIAGYKTEMATAPDVIETDYPYLFAGLDLSKKLSHSTE